MAKHILILNGAMGTMIQRHQLKEADYHGTQFADWHSDLKGNNDLLAITQPALIQGIHEDYLAAGCDIIEIHTFNGTRVMKKSVAYLEPFLEAEKADNAVKTNSKILMATVKGDIHDISKNIAGVVLQ